jgi:hypothetical protein
MIGVPSGTTPNSGLRSIFPGPDYVGDGDDQKDHAAGDHEVLHEDPQGIEDRLPQEDETDGHEEGRHNGLADDLLSLMLLHALGHATKRQDLSIRVRP